MFQIENGREHFWQWDLNQRLIVDDASINEAHFCNRTDDCSLICEVFEEDGKRIVNVPNILLQDIWDIRVYAYCADYTKIEEKFKVYKRSKPADYVYTETEIKDYDDLKARVDEIERSGVSQEAVDAAVSAYLTEHPIEAGATAEEAAQIEANKNAIAQLEANKATKEYVDTALAAINIPTKVSAFENDVGYLTQHQSLDNYYTKAETDTLIPDVSSFATESYVNQKISEAQIGGEVDLSNYYTKTEVDNLVADCIDEAELRTTLNQELNGYALKTEIPDVSGYATKAEISGFITEIPTEYVTDSELAAKGYLTEHQSLEGYAKTTDIPDVSGYQTEEQVIALIQANMPASGDEVSY